MAIPEIIKTVAINRNAKVFLSADFIRNLGSTRLRMMAYIATKIGRLAIMVEAKETGPLAIARNDNTIPIAPTISFKTSRAKAEFLCFISLICLNTEGRIEKSSQRPLIQKVLI